MHLARIIGRATTTARHRSLASARLLVAHMLAATGQPTGDPVLVVDRLGAGLGDLVMITSDGLGLRELLGDRTSPARWWTLGIVDQVVGLPAVPADDSKKD